MATFLKLDGTQALESGTNLVQRDVDFSFEIPIRNWSKQTATVWSNGCIASQSVGTASSSKMFQLYVANGDLKLIHTAFDNTLIAGVELTDGTYRFEFTNMYYGTSANQFDIYRDNVLIASGTFQTGYLADNTTDTFVIGARHGATLSEYGFWATADFGTSIFKNLETDTVLAVWNMESANTGAVPVVVPDTSGNGYDMTGVGFPSTGEDWYTIGGSTPVTFNGNISDININNGTPYSLDLSSYFTGTETPFTYNVQTGTLPTGLTLSGSVISGTPTVDGTQSSITIRATDGLSNTADTNAFSITVATSSNTKPIAVAGNSFNLTTGEVALLDGSGSSDPDLDPITYLWSLQVPNGSSATLSSTTSETPQFTTDVDGVYTVTLVVNDGTEDSDPSQLTVTATTPTYTISTIGNDTLAFTDNTGVVKANTSVGLLFIDSTTNTVTVSATVTTDASGGFTYSSASLVSGRTYIVLPITVDSSPVTARVARLVAS